MDNEKKVHFLNPVKEMDKSSDMFRRLMAKEEGGTYNLKIESGCCYCRLQGRCSNVALRLHVGKGKHRHDCKPSFKKLLEKRKI